MNLWNILRIFSRKKAQFWNQPTKVWMLTFPPLFFVRIFCSIWSKSNLFDCCVTFRGSSLMVKASNLKLASAGSIPVCSMKFFHFPGISSKTLNTKNQRTRFLSKTSSKSVLVLVKKVCSKYHNFFTTNLQNQVF